jgi:Replication-relaxation
MTRKLAIRPIDEKILEEIALGRLLTIKQIQTRFFSAGSYTHVSTLLKHLTEAKYLSCIEPVSQNQPYLFGLGKKGVSYLRSIGLDLTYYPSEHKKLPSSMHLPHLLATNDILLAIARLAENEPDIDLIERRHYLTTPQKNRMTIPDAWVHLSMEQTHLALWFEVDRGSEEQEYIRRKVSTIINFAMHGYLEEFAVPLRAIAFVTTASLSRLTRLMDWIVDEIPQNLVSYFHFARMPETSENTMELFTAPLWQSINGDEPGYLF